MTQAGLPWTPDFETYPIEHKIVSAIVDGNAVTLRWDDAKSSRHHALWLRENSPDKETIHPLSREMLLDPLDIPEDIHPIQAEIAENGALTVVWSHGGHVSRYHPGWLRAHAWFDDGAAAEHADRPPVLWTAETLPSPPTFDGPTALADDDVFLRWLEALRDCGIARLESLPVQDGLLEEIVTRIGPIRETNFGRTFNVVVKDDPDSNAYTSASLVQHMDLATRELPPGLQFLFCRANTTSGGEGVYVDGYRIAEDMRREEPEHFEALASIVWEFKNRAKDCDYRAYGPVFARDPEGNVGEVRFTPWLRAPLKAPLDEQRRAYGSIRAFMRRNSERRYQIRLAYRPGDLLAFDNRRALHGRGSYDAKGGSRYLEGCYADRDDLQSCIRTLRRQH